MMRDGSITAVSTNLEISKVDSESIEIVVYKNGEAIGFGNTLDAGTLGIKNDYDVQAKDTVSFGAGDIISVYVDGVDARWEDVITMVEITTIG